MQCSTKCNNLGFKLRQKMGIVSLLLKQVNNMKTEAEHTVLEQDLDRMLSL